MFRCDSHSSTKTEPTEFNLSSFLFFSLHGRRSLVVQSVGVTQMVSSILNHVTLSPPIAHTYSLSTSNTSLSPPLTSATNLTTTGTLHGHLP